MTNPFKAPTLARPGVLPAKPPAFPTTREGIGVRQNPMHAQTQMENIARLAQAEMAKPQAMPGGIKAPKMPKVPGC